ncbi:Predicted oxidoreductase [Sinosporangium album]|uniref:Predicted oxidoreductase n=1 Tax=Sinosporangium album TaxID=504805 RepID=A0A1G7QMF7_9ACTN|nr:aldo/keto reductase [Sinosporangium album]SDF99741.1 Predicted oxidoreductase [Sinosporangium album]
MQQRHLHGLNRHVSAVGAGCWTIGGLASNRGVPIGWAGVDPDEAYAALERAHELGVTLYDTADVYGMGASERLLGRLLAQIDRGQAVVSSKVGYFAGTAAHPYQGQQLLRQFESSCDNLGTDYLDIYFLHSTNFGPEDRYLDEAVGILDELKDDRMVHATGMRAPHTFAAEWATDPSHPQSQEAARFLHLFERIRPDVITVRHNLMSPAYAANETDIFEFARQRGVGVLLKQVLGQALLLGTYSSSAPPAFPQEDHRHADIRFTGSFLRAVHDALVPLGRRFGYRPADLARVALQYALHASPNAAALVGFRNPAQITGSVQSLDPPLSPEDFAEIRHLAEPLRVMLGQHQSPAISSR